MNGYRKLKVWEIIREGDIFYTGIKAFMSVGTEISDLSPTIFRPIKSAPKPKSEKYSYIARIYGAQFYWRWYLVGINGKYVLESKLYKKLSYALNNAKSFCSRVKGVKLEVEK